MPVQITPDMSRARGYLLIIYRYISREILVTLLGVMSVLVLIYIGNRFVRLLATTGEAVMPAAATLQLLLYKTLNSLVLLLPLALFLAVMIGMGRLYKDSEMAALFACGVSIRTIYQAVLAVALAIALLVAAVSLFAGPWAEEQSYRLQDREMARGELENISVGRFLEFDQANGVIYASERDKQGEMEDVFIQGARDDGRQVLIYAHSARYVRSRDGATRYLMLSDGHRYEGTPGGRDFQVIQFARHAIMIPETETQSTTRKLSARATTALLSSSRRSDMAELQWRASMPISTLLLAMLAVPLSRTAPRQGKYAKLFGAILVYVIYSNLIGVAHNWVERGIVTPWLGVWWVHLLMLVAIWVVLARQYGTVWVIKAMLGRTAVS